MGSLIFSLVGVFWLVMGSALYIINYGEVIACLGPIVFLTGAWIVGVNLNDYINEKIDYYIKKSKE